MARRHSFALKAMLVGLARALQRAAAAVGACRCAQTKHTHARAHAHTHALTYTCKHAPRTPTRTPARVRVAETRTRILGASRSGALLLTESAPRC